jgi:hypothetical protein
MKINGFKEGDAIAVFSSGQQIGTGVFIRIEGNFLIWVDATPNVTATNLSTITIMHV